MKAVCYLRVSTDGQAGEDKFGMAAQRDAVLNYAERNNINIVAWYQDEGISGATLDRPGLQDMIVDSKEKQFDTVLVAKMDRVARDLYIALFVEKELLINDVEIISVSEPVSGSDPMQKAFRQMLGVFAELEKDMIAKRLKGGRCQKAKTGGYSGGAAPIGYTVKKGGKVLELDRGKAITVKRVFELQQELKRPTLQQIADRLNIEGHTTAQGKKFQPVQVKRILDRKSVYSGLYKYAGIEADGKHAAII